MDYVKQPFDWERSSGGSEGGARDACPTGGQNSFNFMQFSGKFDKIVCWCPTGELAPPPRGNHGSATVKATPFEKKQSLIVSQV